MKDYVYVVNAYDVGYVVGIYATEEKAKKAKKSYVAWSKRQFGKATSVEILKRIVYV